MYLGADMAHYAFLDNNNLVIEVIVGKDENEDGVNWEQRYSEIRGKPCKRTSYRTFAGQHPNGTPFRKNYAGIGYTYDPVRDAFIPPKPFASWVLNESTCQWNAPVAKPTDGKPYVWNEEQQNWVEVTL